jgi:serine/threonine-protein kinase HipA
MSSKGNVYFKNQLTGSIEKKEDGNFEFSYQNQTSDVSWSLPCRAEAYNSEDLFPFFDGLIPEGWLLNLTQKNWKLPKNDRMALLLTSCQDCIGAAHILDPANTPPPSREIKIHLSTHQKQYFTSDQCLICMESFTKGETLYHKRCAQDLFGFTQAPRIDVSMTDLEDLALMQINQRLTLTGVQKKLSLSPVKEGRNERLTVMGLDGRFILKPSTMEYAEMAELEHVSMKLAELQNIPVAKCGLVFMKSGERAYITRRFDRVKNEKIQMEDFCQLSEKPTEKKYNGSSESLGKVLDKYSDQSPDDKLTLFQILLFSFWIGNADMHLKNFSLWRDPQNQRVRISPGYDFLSTRLLISTKEDSEEMALSINGKKNKLEWKDFQALGTNYKIPAKVIERVRDQMLDSFFDAEDLIERSFLSDGKKAEFQDLLRERSKRLSRNT